MTSILWLRRDLRRHDLPALGAAADASADDVLPVFVIEPALWHAAGPVRRAWLAASIDAAREAYDGALTILCGDPQQVLPELAKQVSAESVHVSRESTPWGVRRDARVARALAGAGATLVETGTPYAVGPGIVTTLKGEGFQVFTPFARAWRDHGWPAPAPDVDVAFRAGTSDARSLQLLHDALTDEAAPQLPPAGEDAALARWQEFCADEIDDYGDGRDRPDLASTSRLSPYLKVGAIHPRTLLHTLAGRERTEGVERFVNELAWREFYADVLWRHPGSAWHDLRRSLTDLPYDDPESPETAELVQAWRTGRTGYPLVDAGMRQLAATGWMHNRVRMVTASFLVKDLHVWWPLGARWFLDHLIDGDLASNSHGWQWVAGTGTDAAPYFRVFNPVAQGLRFDPDGAYVRRWVPELAHLRGKAAHEPWSHPQGYASGYPERIVDHAEQRTEALRRHAVARHRPSPVE